jgi:hypothetical protein
MPSLRIFALCSPDHPADPRLTPSSDAKRPKPEFAAGTVFSGRNRLTDWLRRNATVVKTLPGFVHVADQKRRIEAFVVGLPQLRL